MPGLPDRPDLDQLRRQARELLRAAVSGDPAAVARIRVVSDRITLSAAQQALAREYGCRNWPALRAEVERRRSPLERWSFGGAAAIETRSGTLFLEGLVIAADDALLFTTLTPWGAPSDDGAWPDGAWSESSSGRPGRIDDEIRGLESSTGTGDITIADDQGATYALSLREWSSAAGPSPTSILYRVDPVPEQRVQWIELRGRKGTTARLLRSPRAAVRLGRLTPVAPNPATPNPVTTSPAMRDPTSGALSASLDAADLTDRAELTDRARYHLDLGVMLPTLDGITLQLDSLFSTFSGWSLRLRATPRWWRYGDNGNRKWSPVEISAEDDRGGSYRPSFGGSSARDGHESLTLRFSPRLDPLARRLRLTCSSSTDQIPVDLDLPAATERHGVPFESA
jgi:hypothetical protein